MTIRLLGGGAALLLLLSPAPAPAQTGTGAGGDGTFYVGTYAKNILVIDEATERVVDEIPVTTGIPRDLVLSPDGTRFYLRDVTFEHFEVIDAATRTTTATYTLSEGDTKARIRNYAVHPDHGYAIFVLDSATTLVDRFEIAPRRLVQYDLTARRVIRDIPWPGGDVRRTASMLFSPDGGLLYFFFDDVVAVETDGFTEVERWNLSAAVDDGLGRFNFSFSTTQVNEEPGFFTNVFRVQDEAQNRELMGIARIDLPNRAVDFYTLGPSARLRFALAPGRRTAYAIQSEIGRYEFWAFDLEQRRLGARRVFAGRPRMALATSTNGTLLYVYQAGNTIDLYEAATYDYLRTITIDGDMTTDLIVTRSGAAR